MTSASRWRPLGYRSAAKRFLFVYHGKRHCLGLGRAPERTAAARSAKIDEVLAFLKSGCLELPAGKSIVEFVKHDGRPPASAAERASSHSGKTTVGTLRDRYQAACRGSLESNTVALFEIHFRHLVATLGEAFPLRELDLATLQ